MGWSSLCMDALFWSVLTVVHYAELCRGSSPRHRPRVLLVPRFDTQVGLRLLTFLCSPDQENLWLLLSLVVGVEGAAAESSGAGRQLGSCPACSRLPRLGIMFSVHLPRSCPDRRTQPNYLCGPTARQDRFSCPVRLRLPACPSFTMLSTRSPFGNRAGSEWRLPVLNRTLESSITHTLPAGWQ